MECYVWGGSLRGQAEAIKVALAKNILKAYPEHTEVIKGFKMDYTDPRIRECKKINTYGARKSYTYVRR